MAICFHLLQVLAQSETYNIICFDKGIQKGLSEQISTHCVRKQAEVQISTRIPRVLSTVRWKSPDSKISTLKILDSNC